MNSGGLNFGIYDTAASKLVASTDGQATDYTIQDTQSKTLTTTIPLTGAYYLKVWGNADAVGSYVLTASGKSNMIVSTVGVIDHGTIACTTTTSVIFNTATTCTITPDVGYHLASLIDNNSSVFSKVVNGTYTSGGVTVNRTITGSFAINTYTVTTSFTGNGVGTINGTSSTAGPVACSSPGPCSTIQTHFTVLDLSATPSGLSLFNGWGGACSMCKGLSCSIDIDDPKNCIADFILLGPVRIRDSYFQAIGNASALSSSGDVIEAHATDLKENVTLNKGTDVSIKGGYNGDYSEQIGMTTVQGSLVVGKGSVTLDRLILR
jgi:hypothetical protein